MRKRDIRKARREKAARLWQPEVLDSMRPKGKQQPKQQKEENHEQHHQA